MLFRNWHRWLIAVLGAILAVCVAIVAGAVAVPPELHALAAYAGLVVVFLTALLPQLTDTTGPQIEPSNGSRPREEADPPRVPPPALRN